VDNCWGKVVLWIGDFDVYFVGYAELWCRGVDLGRVHWSDVLESVGGFTPMGGHFEDKGLVLELGVVNVTFSEIFIGPWMYVDI
jgi:hypothetical protein